MPEPWLYLQAMGAAAIASAIFVLATAGARRPASSTRVNSACVLGTGLGLAVGCQVLPLRLAWPPVHGLDRFFMVVVPALLGIELIAGFAWVPRWAAWFLRMSLAAAIPRILLHGSVYLSGSGLDWPVWQSGALLTMCVPLLAGVWGLLSWLFARSPGVSIPLALALSTQCAGLTVMMAGYIKGGAAAFPWAATLVATTIAAWLISKRSGAPAMIGIGVVGLYSLLLIGRFFGRLSTGAALAMLLAPLLCWATEAPFLRHRKPWLIGTLRLALAAIPLLVVLASAKRDFDRDMAPLLGARQASVDRRHSERLTEMLLMWCASPPTLAAERHITGDLYDLDVDPETRFVLCDERNGEKRRKPQTPESQKFAASGQGRD